MASTSVVSSSLLAVTFVALFFVLSVCTPTSEAAPFFFNMPDPTRIQMPDFSSLPRIQMPNLRLPEIDPATMINNGGEAIARTGDGIVVMFENGMHAFMRTSTGLLDGLMGIPHSIMDFFGNAIGNMPSLGFDF